MTATEPADDQALNDVFSSGRDRTPVEAAPTPLPVTPTETAITDAVQAVNEQRMVPLAELTNERKRLKGERDEARRMAAEAEGRARALQDIYGRAGQPAEGQRQQVRIPDPISEPAEYAQYLEWRVAQREQIAEAKVQNQGLNLSEKSVRKEHGNDLVDEALAAAQKAGLVANRYFIQANPDHPWEAMVNWHKQQKIISEVGTDLTAYEKKLREKWLAEQGTGQNTAAPTPQPAATRFPGTIADKTASGPQGSHLTDEAALAGVFASNRKRK